MIGNTLYFGTHIKEQNVLQYPFYRVWRRVVEKVLLTHL